MNIAEALKIKAAAKAYLGGVAVAAQVALTYLPDHQSGYYTAVQVLLGVLGVIGVYAIPNKVAEAKDAANAVADQAKKFASTIVVNTAANTDPKKIASELAWQLAGGSTNATAEAAPAHTALVPPVEIPAVTEATAPAAEPAEPATDPVLTPVQKDTPAPVAAPPAP